MCISVGIFDDITNIDFISDEYFSTEHIDDTFPVYA